MKLVSLLAKKSEFKFCWCGSKDAQGGAGLKTFFKKNFRF